MKGRKLYCISLKNSSYWKALCHLCIEAFILYKVNRASLLVMVCFNTSVNGCLMARDWTEWQFMAQQRLGNAVGAYVASVSHLLLKLGVNESYSGLHGIYTKCQTQEQWRQKIFQLALARTVALLLQQARVLVPLWELAMLTITTPYLSTTGPWLRGRGHPAGVQCWHEARSDPCVL